MRFVIGKNYKPNDFCPRIFLNDSYVPDCHAHLIALGAVKAGVHTINTRTAGCRTPSTASCLTPGDYGVYDVPHHRIKEAMSFVQYRCGKPLQRGLRNIPEGAINNTLVRAAGL